MNVKAVHIAHMYIKECVKSGDTVIDATAGNGYDTLFLSRLIGISGTVISIDIQQEAIFRTQHVMEKHNPQSKVHYICDSHEHIGNIAHDYHRKIVDNDTVYTSGIESLFAEFCILNNKDFKAEVIDKFNNIKEKKFKMDKHQEIDDTKCHALIHIKREFRQCQNAQLSDDDFCVHHSKMDILPYGRVNFYDDDEE